MIVIKNKMMLSLVLGISLTAAVSASERTATKVLPSTDFIELTETYKNRPKVVSENNAFIYLMGLDAPKDSDPMHFGQQVIDWSNQKIANGGKNDAPKPYAPYSIGKTQRILLEKITCNLRQAKPCKLAKHQALARKAISTKAVLLERRQTLLEFPDYNNTMTIDLMASFPDYGSDIMLQQLALVSLWLNRNDYPPEQIKQALQKDHDFRLKQSANAVTLIEKMVAVAGLQNNYYWLNEILKSVDTDTATALTPRYLHKPIPLSALSMQMAYSGELQFFISLFKP